MESYKGKVVIVSGAAGGIGREIVSLLSKSGAIVLATDVDEKSLKNIAKLTQVHVRKHDVRKRTEWENIFKAAQKLGTVYALVNAVGVLKPGFIDTITDKDIDFHIDINIKGVVLGSSIAAREFKKLGSGHIINIASLAGVAPVPGIGLYSTSKFAVRGFTLALGGELSEHGIFTTVVCPDAVRTPMLDLQKDFPEAALTFSGSSPLTPEKIAAAIVRVLGKNKPEILLPWSRGFLAKIASALPALTPLLLSSLRKKGLKKQAQYQKS